MQSRRRKSWFCLYAQLRRADGEAYRNLLLSKLEGRQPGSTKTHANFTGISQQQAIHCERGLLAGSGR